MTMVRPRKLRPVSFNAEGKAIVRKAAKVFGYDHDEALKKVFEAALNTQPGDLMIAELATDERIAKIHVNRWWFDWEKE